MKFASTLVLAGLATAYRIGTVNIQSNSVGPNAIQGAIVAIQMNETAPVTFIVNIYGLAAGSTHGWHLHAQPVDSTQHCSTATGHYNPYNETHGAPGMFYLKMH